VRGLCAVHALTVSEEKVLGLEPAEGTARGNEPKQRMHPDGLSSGAEVAHAPERVAANEDALRREVERDLPPERYAAHGDRIERGAGNAVQRSHVQMNAKAPGEGLAVTPVPIDELDDAGRLPESVDPLVDPLAVDRVSDPDASSGEDGV
jgi:hypothetical protein